MFDNLMSIDELVELAEARTDLTAHERRMIDSAKYFIRFGDSQGFNHRATMNSIINRKENIE